MAEDDLSWIMQSGRAASDRGAGLGFQEASFSRGSGRSERSAYNGGSTGGLGTFLLGLFVGFAWFAWKVAEIVIPILLMIVWEASKLGLRAVGALLDRR